MSSLAEQVCPKGEAWEAPKASANGEKKPPEAGKKEPPQVHGLCLAQVTKKELHWLWQGWIPRGKLVILDGDPDLGKSTLLLDLAARVTTMGVMPDGSQGESGDVIILSAEDDAEDIIISRLEAAGADLSKIHVVEEIGGEPPTIPEDLTPLENWCRDWEPKLLVIDPLTAYLNADVCSDQKVRRALHKLKLFLSRRKMACIALRHLNKGTGTKALYRGGGSIAIIGAARAGILVAADPENPKVRVVAQTKHNYAAEQASLRYQLEWIEAQQACRVAWIPGPCTYRADDLLKVEDKEEKSAVEEAMAWLTEILSQGPMEAWQIHDAAKPAKFSVVSLKRAKKKLGCSSVPIKDAGGKLVGWQWALPTTGSSGSDEET